LAEGGIVEKILETARERGRKILAEAEAKRKVELASGTAKLAAEFEARRRVVRKHASEAEEQELSAFRLEERNKTLKLKRRLLDGVYEAAWKKILQPDVYRRWVESQMALFCRPGDSLVVSQEQSSLFKNDFSALLKKHDVSLSTEQGRFRAGFIVERGKVRLNCTLDEAMKSAAQECEIEVSRLLFGQGAG
jgi:vacuolar-type H+-ATPase subunit E/Vma4